MADATGQPQIVATLRPNRWTIMYADLTISNSGNASAFSVRMEFDPPLMTNDESSPSSELVVPFQEISILRPGESLSSDIGLSFPLLEKSYWVTTSWFRHPKATERESLSYTLTMADSKGIVVLGVADPLVQIAEEVKHIREDWQHVASGTRKTKADVYTSADRIHERRQDERRRRAWNQKAEAQRVSASAASTSTISSTDLPEDSGTQAPSTDS